jgi:hypothetical protein
MPPASQTPAIVIRDYQTEYPDPLSVQAGEPLIVSDKTDYWRDNPAWLWVWCTDPRGKSGWTPATFFEARGQTAIARRDYAATELSATVGETLSIIDAYGGWFWCANQRGQHGWIPQDHVAPTEP